MNASIVVAVGLAILNLLIGVALGWYLRRINSWCRQCGDRLTCQGCGTDASWALRPDPERSVR
ncbi:hypothetical protein [Spirilliplanes yamanashiensis]|uniref:FeoB-associated Cys-rich membrane protein n=1 Tax=Spirilliplanes yamanashiensis TaxID=42233 RepID=A0A8J3Y9X9_9ACTN|nr:hypothetical protein [Spirilliplanes yamanashiensis]MDP9815654.1 hypothetical protein [Spirilliplanes yamanashiensis]GIJ03908.1 hypothetical protein Sya03_32600 [Spirilliplanes yamanashiensis]